MRTGGEMSGHMFFADRYYGLRRRAVRGLPVIEIVAARPSLSSQTGMLPQPSRDAGTAGRLPTRRSSRWSKA